MYLNEVFIVFTVKTNTTHKTKQHQKSTGNNKKNYNIYLYNNTRKRSNEWEGGGAWWDWVESSWVRYEMRWVGAI